MNTTSHELLKRTLIAIDGAYAPSTIRAYKGNFEKFIQFCESENKQALPSHPATVAKFIQLLTKSGLKSASIRLAFASISAIHKFNELPDPTQSSIAKLELRRMHRTLGRSSKQAFALTSPLLKRLLDALSSESIRDCRDKAILMLAYESLMRRSEIVSISLIDIDSNCSFPRHRIKIRRSKTDQESNGHYVEISSNTIDAINQWIERSRIKDGLLFRGVLPNGNISSAIGAAQINRIFKRAAKAANFSEIQIKSISGHSLRVGRSKDALSTGISLGKLMALGRWKKIETALSYAT